MCKSISFPIPIMVIGRLRQLALMDDEEDQDSIIDNLIDQSKFPLKIGHAIAIFYLLMVKRAEWKLIRKCGYISKPDVEEIVDENLGCIISTFIE